MTVRDNVTEQFEAIFGEKPAYLVRAPGRVNIIGDHTDYNDGFVLPMAIDRAVWIALRPRDDDQAVMYALDFDRQFTISTTTFEREDHEHNPAKYVQGVAWALHNAGHSLRGWDGVMQGDVPIGAGLSSSAALELAAARAFSVVSDIEWQPHEMAKLAQIAENQWVGMNSGIMDQMISAVGEAGQALLIDCRSLETQPYPLPPETTVIVMDTGTRRELVTSAYNERRAQCEAAAQYFGVKALRDVSLATFNQNGGELDAVTQRRARHVITENQRVLQARDAMLSGDAVALGALLNASHDSLRDDFEVSSDALNAIVKIAQAHDGCYGARVTGAGFGGCAVALVQAAAADAFVQHVKRTYEQQQPHQAAIYVCEAADGAAVYPFGG